MQEADRKRKEREQEEQRTRKSLAYSRWHLDASNKFYEAVDLPSSEEYAGEYLTYSSMQSILDIMAVSKIFTKWQVLSVRRISDHTGKSRHR